MVAFLEFAANLSKSTADALVIIFFVGFFLISIFIFSYRRIIDNVISIYVTTALIDGVPASHRLISQISQSNNDPTYMAKMFVLGVIMVALFVLVSWGVSERGGRDDDNTNWLSDWWKIVPLSFLQAGLLFSIILGYLDPLWASNISWSTRRVFIGETAKIIWFILPIAFLIVVSKLSIEGTHSGHTGGHGHH